MSDDSDLFPPPTPSTALVYAGTPIAERHEMLSLTDMWTAARLKHVEDGGDPAAFEHRRPDDWKKDAANRAFLDQVARTLNARPEGIWVGKRGIGGGTFAHWQVALGYAKWISPEFHMWCNTVVRAHMEGVAGTAPTAVPLVTSSIRAVAADFKALFSIGRLIGLDRNQSALAANCGTRQVHDIDLLATMGTKHLEAPQQAPILTPTDIGVKLGMSGQAVNKILIERGLQVEFRDSKDRLVKEPTDAGRPYAVWQDTSKKHSDGTPVRQLKWSGDVLALLQSRPVNEAA